MQWLCSLTLEGKHVTHVPLFLFTYAISDYLFLLKLYMYTGSMNK